MGQGIVRHDRNSRLLTGYTLDLVGDLCIIVPHNPDGKIVVRFHRMVDPEEVRRAAEEDREKRVLRSPFTRVCGRGVLGCPYPGRLMRSLSDHEDAVARSGHDDRITTATLGTPNKGARTRYA
jgi:hypothetical protein